MSTQAEGRTVSTQAEGRTVSTQAEGRTVSTQAEGCTIWLYQPGIFTYQIMNNQNVVLGYQLYWL